jgi:NitT/TauT family transport system permease protein
VVDGTVGHAAPASTRHRAARLWTRVEKPVLGLTGIFGFVGLWELMAGLGIINPLLLSSPTRVGDAFGRQLASGQLWLDLQTSSVEFVLAFGIAACIGVPVGVLIAVSKRAEYTLDPFIWGLYVSPSVAFIPLLIIWLGFAQPTVVAVAVMIAVVPIIVNTQAGVRGVNPTLLQAADAFGASVFARTVKVLFPGAVSLILAGFRLAIGRVLIGIVVGEMFASNAGLGFRMTYYGQMLRASDVLVSLLTIVLAGVLLTQLIRVVEDRTQAWRS